MEFNDYLFIWQTTVDRLFINIYFLNVFYSFLEMLQCIHELIKTPVRVKTNTFI